MKTAPNGAPFSVNPHSQVEREIGKVRRAAEKVARRIRKFEKAGLFDADTAAKYLVDLQKWSDYRRNDGEQGEAA